MIRVQRIGSIKSEAFTFVQILSASLLLALSARVSIPLYFTPVPLTLQTLAVMFIGATLGSRKGTLAILLYLFEGALGFPVFAGELSVFSIFSAPGSDILSDTSSRLSLSVCSWSKGRIRLVRLPWLCSFRVLCKWGLEFWDCRFFSA